MRSACAEMSANRSAPVGAPNWSLTTLSCSRSAQARPQVSGTYHVAAAGETSWHGYAQRVIEFARAAGRPLKVTDDAITAVPSSAFPTPVRRPANSRLNTQKFRDTFGLSLPAWQTGVERMLVEVLN